MTDAPSPDRPSSPAPRQRRTGGGRASFVLHAVRPLYVERPGHFGLLAAFAGLSPQGHSSGSSVRKPGQISRVGSQRLRGMLHMCALSAKRTNTALADFVGRMTSAGKPPKVILVAVARKLLAYAHAVIRTQEPFTSAPDAPSPA